MCEPRIIYFWHYNIDMKSEFLISIYISSSFLSDEKSKNQLLTSIFTQIENNIQRKNLTWVYPHYIEKYAKFLYGIYFKMKIMGGMRILWCTRIIPLQKKLAKFHFHNQVKLRSIKILIGSSQNSSHTLFHFLLIKYISFLKNAYLVKHTVIVVLQYLLECNHRNLFFKMGFRWGSIWKVDF